MKLRKIDCVMVRADDPERAARFWAEVFGLEPSWSYDGSFGLRFSESDAEVVLHSDARIPPNDPSYLVDDVERAIEEFTAAGCEVLAPVFDIRIGRCAVIRDPFGATLSILDMTRGPVEPNWSDAD